MRIVIEAAALFVLGACSGGDGGKTGDGQCGICTSAAICPTDEPAEGDLCSDIVTDELMISCFWCDGDAAATRAWGCGLETDLRWTALDEPSCDI
jgi:hypothetical protein